jgi:hypothetical protein
LNTPHIIGKKINNEKFKTEIEIENLNDFIKNSQNLDYINKKYLFENLLNEYLLIKNLKNSNKNLKLSINSIQLFEKIALIYSKENIYSYQLNGEIINKYKIERYDIDIENKEIIFQLNKKINPKKENNLKLIVLDTSPYLNFKNKEKGFLTLRKGDERGGFDIKLFELIKKISKENNIPTEIKPSSLGNTEFGKVTLMTNNKINSITIQLPTMNYHTPIKHQH